MLLSRFWYVLLSLVLGAAVFVLSLAQSFYNRSGQLSMAQGLSSDSQVVGWYLGADARQRSAQLIQFGLEPDIQKALAESSKADSKISDKTREKLDAALKRIHDRVPAELQFSAVFAIDQHGRVVAHLGYDQARGMDDFELGGYPVVADALHGFIRDDTLVLDRLYRVVARPVEAEFGQLPAGAIVGARVIDDDFAGQLTKRTGAAVAFYTPGSRQASGAPEGFDKSQLDQIVRDMEQLGSDKDYAEIGRSAVRPVAADLGVVYARLPGEAWELGAGYAVGRQAPHIGKLYEFFSRADDRDKANVSLVLVGLVTLLAAFLGLLFSYFEHTAPLNAFRREAVRLAKGETDQLVPSRLWGIYRKLASDLNDGMDLVAAKGGAPRRAADLKQVLGDLPAEPQMSAFSFPGDASSPVSSDPRSRGMPMPPSVPNMPKPKPLPKAPGSPVGPARRDAAPAEDPEAERLAEWQAVYQEFVATKEQCGESTEGFTYDKFEQTLTKNQETLIKRHGATRVKFSVYIKDGKAALKASPLKD